MLKEGYGESWSLVIAGICTAGKYVLAWAYNGTNTSPSVFLLQFEWQLWL